jgi:hypothetical protein
MEEILNIYLKAQGKSITGEYLYRLVWSDNILENRYGTFNEFTSPGLFVRTFTGIKLVPKYSYIKERWILEKWAPGNLTRNPETPDASAGDYIPVYVFEDGKGKYLPPTRRVLEFLIGSLNGNVRKDIEPSEEYLQEKEIAAMVESFDDHPSAFATAGQYRNAVGYTKEIKGA